MFYRVTAYMGVLMVTAGYVIWVAFIAGLVGLFPQLTAIAALVLLAACLVLYEVLSATTPPEGPKASFYRRSTLGILILVLTALLLVSVGYWIWFSPKEFVLI